MMGSFGQSLSKGCQGLLVFSAFAFAPATDLDALTDDGVVRRPKVALVSHSSGLYGAQRQILDLATCLPDCGVSPILVLPEVGPLADEAHQRDIPTCVLPFRNWLHNRTTLQWWRKQWLTHKAVNMALKMPELREVDLVHSNTFVSPFGALLAMRLDKPHVWHVHERAGEGRETPFYRSTEAVRSFVKTHATFGVGPSQSLCLWMEKYFEPDRIRCIPNGVYDAGTPLQDAWPTSNEGPLRLLSLGRLGKAKGTLNLIESLGQLTRAGLDVRLTLAGDACSEFRDALKQTARENGVSDRVNCVGFVRDPACLYREHDILMVGSEYESFGRVAAEAMLNGCLVVSTKCGGPEEIICHRQNGLLVDVGSVDQMSYAVRWLFEHPEDAREIRRAAYSDVKDRFSATTYAERFAQLYAEALASRQLMKISGSP